MQGLFNDLIVREEEKTFRNEQITGIEEMFSKNPALTENQESIKLVNELVNILDDKTSAWMKASDQDGGNPAPHEGKKLVSTAAAAVGESGEFAATEVT